MVRVVEGKLSCPGIRVAIVASRFNELVVDQLIEGALAALGRAGARPADIAVFRVPGAFEIPQLLRRVIDPARFDAAVCLGCVIRGGTPHFEYISGAVTDGINRIAETSPIPIAFGVLTTDSLEQAIDRAGAKSGNKGAEAALTAVEMANLLRNLAPRSRR